MNLTKYIHSTGKSFKKSKFPLLPSSRVQNLTIGIDYKNNTIGCVVLRSLVAFESEKGLKQILWTIETGWLYVLCAYTLTNRLKALTEHLGEGSRVDSFDPQW